MNWTLYLRGALLPLGPGGRYRDLNGDVGCLLGDIIIADACDGRRAGCSHKPSIIAVVRSHNDPAIAIMILQS
jgi:hypothetical protein